MVSMKNTLVSFLVSLAIFLCISFCEAKELVVDGKANSWKIPSSPDEFNKWAEKTRFQIGDYLVLNYDPNSDSVLQVKEEDYKNCNKSNPLKSYQDGETKILLNKSGSFFFISGANGHCEKGQKLEVKVLSPQHSSMARSPALAPTPATHTPVEILPPAPVPANGSSGIKFGIIGSFIAMLGSFLVLA